MNVCYKGPLARVKARTNLLCKWMCGHLILVTRVKQRPGTAQHNLEKRGRKRDEYIVSGRNILSGDEVGAGFHSVQSH